MAVYWTSASSNLGNVKKQWSRGLLLKAQSKQKSLSPTVAQVIVQRSRMDKQWLHTELEKLICYVGERSVITQEDINAVGVKANEELIWEFCKVVFQRRAAAAVCFALGTR